VPRSPNAQSRAQRKDRAAQQHRPTKLKEDPPPYRTGQDKLRFIDLFCGIGGFRIAFENAGCECVFSSDWNEMAQITYEANFGEKPHGDIYSVPDNAIPPHNILCAGFPCQPFSIAGVSKKLSLGKKHGFEDKEQGNLFFKLAELIDHHRPDAFVLENVKHLTRHDQGRTFRIIHETLTEHLKYHVHHRVVDAQSVVPQHRERIFLVGFRERRAFEFPESPAAGAKARIHPRRRSAGQIHAYRSSLELSPSLRGKAQGAGKCLAVKSRSADQCTAETKELSCCVEVLWRVCGIKV
jgi:DNA-cytosine methyltransferase